MNGYIRKTFEYAAGNIFDKILLLLLLPLFTRFMVPEEYAVYANVTIFISFLSLLYLLGLQQALFSHFYQYDDKRYQFTVISSILFTIIISGILFSFLIYYFRIELAQLITRDRTNQDIFIYVSIILFCDVLYAIVLRIINTMERSFNYALLSVVRNLTLLILIFIASLAGKFSLKTVFIYMSVSSLLSVIIALINVLKIMAGLRQYSRSMPAIFSFPIMIDLLNFGLPMIPGTIALMVLRVSDRYMLTYLSANGLYDVGIYAIGYRIGMILTFLNSIISLVYFPYAMKIAKDPRSASSYRRMFRAYAVWGGLVGFLVILFAWELSLLLLDAAYYEAVKIVAFGVISSFLFGLFNIINISFYIRKKAGNIALAVGSGSVINIILNFLLIPRIGIYGAGIASVISYFFIFLFNYNMAENLYPLNFELKPVFLALSGMILISLVNFFFFIIPEFTILKIALLIAAAGYLYFKYLHKHVLNQDISDYIAEKFRI
jgi:O-antigen/teichoic acid export membrane protein